MARPKSILSSGRKRNNKPKKKVTLSKISTVHVIPNFPTPRFGFLRRNYPTSPITRGMNAYRKSMRPRTPRPIPSNMNKNLALAAARREAIRLIEQIERNKNNNFRPSFGHPNSNNNLYK